MQKPSSPMDILHAEVCAGDPAAAFYGAEFAVYQHANTVQRPHGGGLVSQGSGGSKFPKKREQVKNACVNCQKACKKCDDIRPCPRCVKYNMSSRCYDSARKQRKKGFRRGSNDGINSSGTSSPYSLMAMAAELPPSLSYQNRGMPQGLGPFTAYGPGPHYDGIEHHRRQSEWDKLNVLANVCTAVLDQDHSSPDSPIIPYEPSSHGSLSSDDDHMYRIGNRSRPMRFDKAPWGAEPASRRNSADSNAYSVSQRRGSGLASSFSSGSPNGINEDSDSPLTRWESPAQNASPVRAGSSTYMELGIPHRTLENDRISYSPSDDHYRRPPSDFQHRMPPYELERRMKPQEHPAATMMPRVSSSPEYTYTSHPSNRLQAPHHQHAAHRVGPRIPRQPSFPYPQHLNRSIYASSPAAWPRAPRNPGPYGGAGLLQYNDHATAPAPPAHAPLPSIREALNSVGLGLEGPRRGIWD